MLECTECTEFPGAGGGEGVCFAKDKMTRHIYIYICVSSRFVLECTECTEFPGAGGQEV